MLQAHAYIEIRLIADLDGGALGLVTERKFGVDRQCHGAHRCDYGSGQELAMYGFVHL